MKRIVRFLLFAAVLLLTYMCVVSVTQGMTNTDADKASDLNPIEHER